MSNLTLKIVNHLFEMKTVLLFVTLTNKQANKKYFSMFTFGQLHEIVSLTVKTELWPMIIINI